MARQVQLDWTMAGAGAALAPLDSALQYLRHRGHRVLPLYVVGMAPFTAVMVFLLDAVTSGHRSALPFGCLLLVGATLWRWVWLAALQRRIQEDLRGEPPLPLRRRARAIFFAKLAFGQLILWGGFLVIPAYYGLLLSGLTVPALLEDDGVALTQIRRAFGWVQAGSRRLVRLMMALGVMALLALVAVAALHWFLLETALPSLLGLDVQDLLLTVRSMAWSLCLGYLLFVLFDLYWAVASVMIFYDLQSRRLGADLRLRLQLVREAQK